jgi:polysaccharide export outer membrane protein
MIFKKPNFVKGGVGLSATLLICLLVSCRSSRVGTEFLYFQNGLDSMGTAEIKEVPIKNNDILNIHVNSKTLNQEQTLLFNMPVNSGSVEGYNVNAAGNIDLPIIGSIKAAGSTITQLQSSVTEKVGQYVKDPVVNIKFAQFNINVLGEVHSPGVKNFQSDNVTIIDAISAAGDLTDYGKRDEITVIRAENGKRRYHKLDLRNAKVFQSPAYQLQPNDLVYVGATKNKLKTVDQDPNKGRGLGTALQITSILVTLGTLLITLTR